MSECPRPSNTSPRAQNFPSHSTDHTLQRGEPKSEWQNTSGTACGVLVTVRFGNNIRETENVSSETRFATMGVPRT
jgi:hypothetical protein